MPVFKMRKITSFDSAYKFLVEAVPKTSVAAFKGKIGLEQSRLWMEELGNPQNTFPPIHIAGTSGKGTVSHLIATLLEAHGKKTALITSPHAYDIRERILIGNKKLTKPLWVKLINEILPSYTKMKSMGKAPSYFEVLMALGFRAAARSKVDYCVIETGLGGKLDTSNTIDRADKVCVLTPIGYDHMHILGNTIKEIATQKAGIIHSSQFVFTAPQTREAMRVIKTRCLKEKAPLAVVSPKGTLKKYGLLNPSSLNLQLSGAHNQSNLALALRVLEHICERDGWKISSVAIKKALRAFTIPGRFEINKIPNGKEIVFDGAHNEQKVGALMAALRERYGREPVGFVFASSKEDPAKKLNLIKKGAQVVLLTKYHSRELDMLRPQPDLEKFADGKKLFYLPDARSVASYIKASDIRIWVVTGSFYILGEIKDLST